MPRKKSTVKTKTATKKTAPKGNAAPKEVELNQPSIKELPALKSLNAGRTKAWSGVIARLRIYDQPGSTGKKVFAYKSPGTNSDYVGYSDDRNMIQALFLARDNGQSVTGYTNEQHRIEWLDY
ncbi:MAG: hypothetical protein JXR76_15595 [Deltaproteobacteria bacterium]|nr:hypothetical protein [Deltaproteobacteria bacterium]